MICRAYLRDICNQVCVFLGVGKCARRMQCTKDGLTLARKMKKHVHDEFEHVMFLNIHESDERSLRGVFYFDVLQWMLVLLCCTLNVSITWVKPISKHNCSCLHFEKQDPTCFRKFHGAIANNADDNKYISSNLFIFPASVQVFGSSRQLRKMYSQVACLQVAACCCSRE